MKKALESHNSKNNIEGIRKKPKDPPIKKVFD